MVYNVVDSLPKYRQLAHVQYKIHSSDSFIETTTYALLIVLGEAHSSLYEGKLKRTRVGSIPVSIKHQGVAQAYDGAPHKN